jgi:hypothetical protein
MWQRVRQKARAHTWMGLINLVLAGASLTGVDLYLLYGRKSYQYTQTDLTMAYGGLVLFGSSLIMFLALVLVKLRLSAAEKAAPVTELARRSVDPYGAYSLKVRFGIAFGIGACVAGALFLLGRDSYSAIPGGVGGAIAVLWRTKPAT